MQTVFIVNSRIGPRKISTFVQALLTYHAHTPHTVRYTRYPGHAQTLAREAISLGAHRVVAVGGDGTVNEILQIVAGSNTSLGIRPCGSGNGIARHCGISTNIHTAMSMLLNGVAVKVDIGKINEYYFISNAGVGFDGHICHQIRQFSARGLSMYSKHVLKNLLTYKPQDYQLVADGEPITEKAFFINIAMARSLVTGSR
jgi:Sphingosine kinase and enzymes related to eukaryotic diacylglycerol kinase